MGFSFFAFGYFFGSVPFGYLIGKYFFSKDIREYYSKNIGATNVSRVLGKKVGIIVFILDFLKSYLPAIVILNILNYKDLYQARMAFTCAAVAGVGAIFGHMNPYILEFKGGKGVATFFGAISALNLILAVLGGIVWVILFLLFKISAVSSLISVACVTVGFFLPYLWIENIFLSDKIKLMFLIITALIFIRHIENIVRIIEKKEYKA